MSKSILVILIGKRGNTAIIVQKHLTAWGCMIKIRSGIHERVLGNCSDKGLNICEMVGEKAKPQELA